MGWGIDNVLERNRPINGKSNTKRIPPSAWYQFTHDEIHGIDIKQVPSHKVAVRLRDLWHRSSMLIGAHFSLTVNAHARPFSQRLLANPFFNKKIN